MELHLEAGGIPHGIRQIRACRECGAPFERVVGFGLGRPRTRCEDCHRGTDGRGATRWYLRGVRGICVQCGDDMELEVGMLDQAKALCSSCRLDEYGTLAIEARYGTPAMAADSAVRPYLEVRGEICWRCGITSYAVRDGACPDVIACAKRAKEWDLMVRQPREPMALGGQAATIWDNIRSLTEQLAQRKRLIAVWRQR